MVYTSALSQEKRVESNDLYGESAEQESKTDELEEETEIEAEEDVNTQQALFGMIIFGSKKYMMRQECWRRNMDYINSST